MLADCYDAHGRMTGFKGPLDPTLPGTYTLLADLLAELVAAFPDRYLHLGGDEVSFACWQVRKVLSRAVLACTDANALSTQIAHSFNVICNPCSCHDMRIISGATGNLHLLGISQLL